MINELIINNFQSHKEAKLEFHPGINIIVGPSDNGKTAVLRALNWIINNKPDGDNFRSKWGGETKAELILDSNEKITRIKNKENIYKLNDLVFKAFGRSVPKEIQEILNISPINLQYQFDSPFLLSNTSGEVAKYLNRIINLEDIDLSFSKINSRIREENNDLKNNENKLNELKIELKELDWIDKTNLKLIELEKLEKSIKEKELKYNKLSGIVKVIDVIEEGLKQYKDINNIKNKINNLMELFYVTEDERRKINKLSNIIKEINITEKELKQYKNVEFMKKKVDGLINLFYEIEDKKEKINNLKRLISGIDNLEQEIKLVSKSINDKKEKYKMLFPDICPLCGVKQ